MVRVGSAAARRFEREMARGHGHNATERAKRARTLGRLLQNALSALVIVIAGIQAIRTLNVRQYPRSENATITVTTLAPGDAAVAGWRRDDCAVLTG